MKKKLLNFYENHKLDLFIIITMLIYISYIILTRELNNLDEIWQFNFSRNIANGLLPYKDFNLVTTPGVAIICGIILKIFGTELICMRIMAIILCTAIMFMIYKCMNVLEINKSLSVLAIMGISYLFRDIYCIDYNFATLLISLICFYNELVYIKTHELFEYNFKYNFLIGILAGSTILMKHTTGLIFSFVFIFYKIFKIKGKDEFKKFLKIAGTRLLGVLIPVIILLAYFLINNILYDFIDFTILGISSFKNSVPYKELFNEEKLLSIRILAVIMPIVLIAIMVKFIISKENKDLILFAFSISIISIIYPISDETHFLLSTTILMIAGIYLIQKIIYKIPTDKIKLSNNKKFWISAFIEVSGIIIGFLLICISVEELLKSDIYIYTSIPNYKYIPSSYGIRNAIYEVDEYIEKINGTTYIVDGRAATFMVPLNRYNKYYDMLNNGNLGTNGINEIFNELKNRNDLTLLIVKDDVGLNWQTPSQLIDYIKENYTKKESVSFFDVYVKE